MYQLVLASKSPRRKLLLEEAGIKFTIDLLEVSEMIDENLNIAASIEQIALQKASPLINKYKSLKLQRIIVLSGDTIVSLEGKILGKPENETKAKDYLLSLSGKWHEVITGYCLYNLDLDQYELNHEVTKVKFRGLTESEVLDYISSGEPMDKAGAYAVQGHGGKFVEKIKGDYNNVVGFPVDSITKKLKELGWEIEQSK